MNSGTNPTAYVTNPTGPQVNVYDAPGLPLVQGGAPLLYASVYWFFELQVTVSSGGQTIQCPTVDWNANVWFVQFHSNTMPLAQGAVNVITQPTP